jgi:RND family efflux transporter MFP subunit
MAPEIRAAGSVTLDETLEAEVNTKVDGWIRDLYADYTGRAIRRGEPLFTIYSPDLIASENEYLLALRGQAQAHASNSLPDYADRLVDAARERLLRLDVSAADIDALAARGRASDTVTFFSPVSGVILEKPALRGMRVMTGQMLFRIADLSTVWVEAEVYEPDLPFVRVGSLATVTVQAFPDRPFTGRVSYIYPTVAEQTRTIRARVTLPNPEGRLKPNMLATVALQAPRSSAIVVPLDALVDTGTQQLVFIAQGDGRFMPADVRTGRRASGQVEVLGGLKEGDEIAASATFFLDSESQLHSALQNYSAPAASAAGDTAAPALDMTFTTEPEPARVGENTVRVTIADTGKATSDASVSVTFLMPAMPAMNMPAARAETTLVATGSGEYRGTVQLMTAGRWDVTVTATRAGRPLGARQFAAIAR